MIIYSFRNIRRPLILLFMCAQRANDIDNCVQCCCGIKRLEYKSIKIWNLINELHRKLLFNVNNEEKVVSDALTCETIKFNGDEFFA